MADEGYSRLVQRSRDCKRYVGESYTARATASHGIGLEYEKPVEKDSNPLAFVQLRFSNSKPMP